MTAHLTLRNRQRSRLVRLDRLRRCVQHLLAETVPHARVDLGIHLVGAAEMARINARFLGHAGATDVITFDYADPADRKAGLALLGEILVCVDEAVTQARRFRTTWTSELARYIIHGLLHLEGFDDHRPAARQRMKREEDRRLRALARGFVLNTLAADTTLRP